MYIGLLVVILGALMVMYGLHGFGLYGVTKSA